MSDDSHFVKVSDHSHSSSVEARPARAPGPRAGTFTLLRALKRDPLGFLLSLRRDHGDVARVRVGWQEIYLLSHPDAIRHVLVDHSANYTKATRDYDVLRVALGEGLVTSDGELWRRQRRIAQPAFHREAIAGFARVMVEKTEAMLSRWQARREPVDMAQEMTRLTLGIVGATLFSVDLGEVIERLGAAVATANHALYDRMTSVVGLPLLVPTPRNLRLRRALQTIDEMVYGEIGRRRDGERRHDLLSMLLEARDPEGGAGMSDRQLRDEIVTMFVAGHETTANLLAWCFTLLSTHPDVARRVEEEVGRALGGRPATLDDLPAMPYARQVIQETLRLYPPVWAIGRLAVEDDVIDGYTISAGADVTLSAYVTHRHPDFWVNPEGFDPDRFADIAGLPRYAYFPFSGGARQCIGNTFAMMEAQLILATVFQRFRPELVAGHPVVPEPLVTLRPRHGVRMHLRALN